MVFTVNDNAISPLRGQFERAVQRIPQAHDVAEQEGVGHLHQAVLSAAQEQGLPTAPIGIYREGGQSYVGIDNTPEGDMVADHEFGHDEDAPNPVLRSAHNAALPHARARYAQTLIREIGF